MRVVLVGNGVGGLAAAQGLRRVGVDVVVLERDANTALTGGYRLHLSPSSVGAVRELLPPKLFEELVASAAGARVFGAAFRDYRGRVLFRAQEPTQDFSLDVDRVTLRQIVADGLGGILRLGASCSGWREHENGVTVTLDQGEEIEADLLVIANGPHSALATARAGMPLDVSAGYFSITGRTSWSEVSAGGQAFLGHLPQFSAGPRGVALFATVHDPVGGALVSSSRARRATTEPTVIWGLVVQDEQLDPWSREHLRDLEPGRLVELAGELLRARHWHQPVRDVVAQAEKESVSAYRLHKSDPDHLAPWRAGRVSVLGDAVHAMPPTGGRGAATALLDAQALMQELSRVLAGEQTVPVAIEAFESRMRAHAAPAVRASLQPLQWLDLAATPAGAIATQVLAPVAGAASSGLRGLSTTFKKRRQL